MRICRLLPLLILPLAGCAVVPPAGPGIVALPPPGKDLQVFRNEDINCRNYAYGQTGYGAPAQAAAQSAAGSAAIGTAVGAAAGAIIGSASGQAGAGAAIGAGTGLLVGSAVGANTAYASSAALQAVYDTAYAQCMASAGNVIQAPPVPVAVPYAVPYYAYPYGYPTYAPYWRPAPYYGGYGYWGRPYGWR
jgi:hypothetical protein